MRIAKWLFGIAIAAANPAVLAVEVGGVKLPDTVQAEPAQQLILNGAGLRTKFFVKVYAGALYLPVKANSLDAVLAQPGPKRILVRFIHKEVEADKLIEAWNEGFAANQSEAELAGLKERIATFNGFFETMKAGDEVVIDLFPDGKTRVSIKSQPKGTVSGTDFQVALLKIWLGERPADASLKRAMLGQ